MQLNYINKKIMLHSKKCYLNLFLILLKKINYTTIVYNSIFFLWLNIYTKNYFKLGKQVFFGQIFLLVKSFFAQGLIKDLVKFIFF
jgi:hypothetical protein